MTKSALALPPVSSISPMQIYSRAVGLVEHIPMSAVQLASRLAVAHVFWNSAQSKLASWPVTLQLFTMEYHVPILPPEIAAPLATATELCGSILLILGLFSRLAAVALLGVVTTIQLFVFPGNWGEHSVWASLLLLILARGAGAVSLDHLAMRLFGNRT
jgi:putative oxidoreductase